MPDTTIMVNQSPSEVDWAVIANKALDMGTDVAKTMADKVKEVAPEAWEILIRQVYVDAITPSLTAFLIGLSFLFLYWLINKRLWKSPYNEDGGYDMSEKTANTVFGRIFPLASMFISGLVGIILSVNIVKVFINPKYYAIQKLFELAGMK